MRRRQPFLEGVPGSRASMSNSPEAGHKLVCLRHRRKPRVATLQ